MLDSPSEGIDMNSSKVGHLLKGQSKMQDFDEQKKTKNFSMTFHQDVTV